MADEKPPGGPGPEIPSLAPPAAPRRAGSVLRPTPASRPRTDTQPQPRGELDPDWLTEGSSVEVGARSAQRESHLTRGELHVDWLALQGDVTPGTGASASSEFEADDFDSFASAQALSLEGALPAETEETELQTAEPRRALHAGVLPSGCSPAPHELDVTLADARELADFGEPPPVFLAVPYAVRVHLRRRDLRVRLGDLERALAAAEEARDAALVSIVTPLRQQLESDDRFRGSFARAEALAAEVTVARSRVSAVSDEHARAMERVAAERGAIEQEVTARRAHDDARRATFERVDHEFKRLEARVKRLHIELRNARALEQQQQPQPPGAAITSPADIVERVASAEAQLASLGPELDALRANAEAARASAEVAHVELLGTELRLRVHDQQTAAAQAQYSQASGAQVLSLRDAERRQRTALADITRALLGTELGRTLDEASLELARTHDARVRALASDVRRHALAMEAYDAAVLKAGHIIVAVLAVSLAVLVLGIIAGLL